MDHTDSDEDEAFVDALEHSVPGDDEEHHEQGSNILIKKGFALVFNI